MAVEIRNVPPNWDHPKDEKGQYLLLKPDIFEDDFAYWEHGLREWLKADEPLEEDGCGPGVRGYLKFEGVCPDPWDYADYQGEKATHFQLYNIEGFPESPVFGTVDELIKHTTVKGTHTGYKLAVEDFENIQINLSISKEPDREKEQLRKAKKVYRDIQSATRKRKRKKKL